MKAVRGAEIGLTSLNLPAFKDETDEQIFRRVGECTDQRLFAIFEAMKRGMPIERIHEITLIDEWFLAKLGNLVEIERAFAAVKAGRVSLSQESYLEAKKAGYPDKVIEALTGIKIADREQGSEGQSSGNIFPVSAVYKMVDTCAGEFNAETPYFYATYDTENEAAEFLRKRV
jgi:carbamoyl-phosphate synthase large subunit